MQSGLYDLNYSTKAGRKTYINYILCYVGMSHEFVVVDFSISNNFPVLYQLDLVLLNIEDEMPRSHEYLVSSRDIFSTF